MNDKPVTYKEICDILEYNPDTGCFIWLIDRKNSKKGSVAGSKGKKYYSMISVYGRSYPAHRLAWLLVMQKWPIGEIDHIDHDKRNNKFINLRDVTQQENKKNLPLAKNNTSGISGVSFVNDRWRVAIGVNGMNFPLGGKFIDFFEACCARKSAENKYEYHANHGS